MTTYTELQSDLEARWVPTAGQLLAAQRVLDANLDLKYAYTVHLLLAKDTGVWTKEVVVEPVPGVWVERNDAFTAMEDAAKAKYHQSGKALSNGYACHRRDGTWAVFEGMGYSGQSRAERRAEAEGYLARHRQETTEVAS